ncbi:MAG: hypothetical protein JRI95_10355 [Deltaproteobacteria bacterium]|nr:hypothetical protein [Deltaproteobacteria bacterium]
MIEVWLAKELFLQSYKTNEARTKEQEGAGDRLELVVSSAIAPEPARTPILTRFNYLRYLPLSYKRI